MNSHNYEVGVVIMEHLLEKIDDYITRLKALKADPDIYKPEEPKKYIPTQQDLASGANIDKDNAVTAANTANLTDKYAASFIDEMRATIDERDLRYLGRQTLKRRKTFSGINTNSCNSPTLNKICETIDYLAKIRDMVLAWQNQFDSLQILAFEIVKISAKRSDLVSEAENAELYQFECPRLPDVSERKSGQDAMDRQVSAYSLDELDIILTWAKNAWVHHQTIIRKSLYDHFIGEEKEPAGTVAEPNANSLPSYVKLKPSLTVHKMKAVFLSLEKEIAEKADAAAKDSTKKDANELEESGNDVRLSKDQKLKAIELLRAELAKVEAIGKQLLEKDFLLKQLSSPSIDIDSISRKPVAAAASTKPAQLGSKTSTKENPKTADSKRSGAKDKTDSQKGPAKDKAGSQTSVPAVKSGPQPNPKEVKAGSQAQTHSNQAHPQAQANNLAQSHLSRKATVKQLRFANDAPTPAVTPNPEFKSAEQAAAEAALFEDKTFTVSDLIKTKENYDNYKNTLYFFVFRPRTLASSKESNDVFMRLLKAENDVERFVIATKFIAEHPKKRFAIELKKMLAEKQKPHARLRKNKESERFVAVKLVERNPDCAQSISEVGLSRLQWKP